MPQSASPEKNAKGGPTAGREFDGFAAGYDGGYGHRLKGSLSKAPEEFVEIKARRLIKDYGERQPGHAPRLLDFGCGAGWFMASIRKQRFACELLGCDISAGMLAEARANWQKEASPPLIQCSGNRLPFDSGVFDVVVACCVFHHIPPQERSACFSEIGRVLKPGGFFYLFEHNPANPLTRYLVKNTPIDASAVLLPTTEVRAAIRQAGLQMEGMEFFLFFPPRLKLFAPLEKCFAWLPLGGQYQVVGSKPVGISDG